MRVLLWVGFGISIAITLCLILIGGWWYVGGGRIYGVQTGSMQPLIEPGDAVLVEPVQPAALRVGDIVAYRKAGQPQIVVSHRLVAMDRPSGTLITKGDHNRQPDLAITRDQVLGRVTAVAPDLGAAAAWLRQPLHIALCIYLPILMVLLKEFRRWYRQALNVSYRLYGR